MDSLRYILKYMKHIAFVQFVLELPQAWVPCIKGKRSNK